MQHAARLYTLHFTLYTKKSHSSCAYEIFSLPLRSNLLHHIYYENNHHYLSSNYGTQILSLMWCCVYLSARESREVPMCRRGTLARHSCTSGSALPQPMPLPQVPHRIRNIQLTPFSACLSPSSYSAPSCYCSALLWYGYYAGS